MRQDFLADAAGGASPSGVGAGASSVLITEPVAAIW